MNQKAGWALVGLGVLFYLFVFPHGIHGDGYVRYEALLKSFSEGRLQPMLYSYVGPLISSPLYLLGFLVKDPYWWMSRFNTFVFLGFAWFIWREFRKDWKNEQSLFFLLFLFAGTMFPKHITDYYSEVLSSCLAAAAILLYLKNRFCTGSILLLLSAWNMPGTVAACSLVLCFFAWQKMQLRFLLVGPLLPAGILGENWLKYGAFFPDAYLEAVGATNLLPYSGGPGFTYPLFFGLLSVFFSYGKGLIFFSPGLLAVFSRELFALPAARFLLPALAYIMGLLVIYPRWWAWTGDWFWGPRFYLFTSIWAAVALAALLPAASSGFRQAFFWLVGVGLSVWVSFQGITFGQDFLEYCYSRGNEIEFICHYVPEFSVLWRPFVVWPELRGRKVAFAVYFALVAIFLLRGPARFFLGKAYGWLLAEFKRIIRVQQWRI